MEFYEFLHHQPNGLLQLSQIKHVINLIFFKFQAIVKCEHREKENERTVQEKEFYK